MYNYLWYFVIYAFLGWCGEVIFAAFKHGKFVNRGFCNGPVCPIYGFGVVIVALCLTPIKHNIAVLYIGSVLLTSALELVTGFLMQKIFHNRWWDYSKNKFNIGGYVCLSFSLLWGVACVIVVDLVHPIVEKTVGVIPKMAGYPIVSIIIAAVIADAVYTIVCVNKFNKKLRQMDEFTKTMHNISDKIGDMLAENTLTLIENSAKLKEEGIKTKAEITAKTEKTISDFAARTEKTRTEFSAKNEKTIAELREKLEELQAKKDALFAKNAVIHSRLLKAFPEMKTEKYIEAFEEFRQKIFSYKK